MSAVVGARRAHRRHCWRGGGPASEDCALGVQVRELQRLLGNKVIETSCAAKLCPEPQARKLLSALDLIAGAVSGRGCRRHRDQSPAPVRYAQRDAIASLRTATVTRRRAGRGYQDARHRSADLWLATRPCAVMPPGSASQARSAQSKPRLPCYWGLWHAAPAPQRQRRGTAPRRPRLRRLVQHPLVLRGPRDRPP